MTTNSSGVEIVNSFITPKGTKRILEVTTHESGGVDINFTSITEDGENGTFKCIPLNRREALALVFYLLRKMLPGKFLANKFKKEEKEGREEEKEKKECSPLNSNKQ